MMASTDYQLAKADHFDLICKENVNTQDKHLQVTWSFSGFLRK